MRFLGLAFGLTVTATMGAAESFTIGDLVIENTLAKTTPKTAMAGAGYLTIMNAGDTADRLIAVEADFPRVMIHDTELVDDVARMVHLDGINIAPGEMVTLSPGGMHVMFMGLNGDPLEEGETIPATLVFEDAGRLEIIFDVTTLEAIQGDGHAGHGDHSGDGDKASDDHDHK